jgi:Flp pilus assembly protein TadG
VRRITCRARGSQHRGSQHRGSRDRGSQHRGSQHRGSRDRGSQHRGSQHRGSRDRGALVLSYIIIVPVFMLAVLVIVQGALWYLAREAALAAARQGADAARLPGAAAGAGPAAALTFARDSASGYLIAPTATASGTTRTTVQITVSGHVPTFVPLMVFEVSQTVQAPVEQFTVPGVTPAP